MAGNRVWVKREHLLSICPFQRNSRETWRGTKASRAATCYCQRATIIMHAWVHTHILERKIYPTSCLNYPCTVRRYCYCSSDWGSRVLAKHICNGKGVNYTVQMGVRWWWQGRWACRYWMGQEDWEDEGKVLCWSKSTGCLGQIGVTVKRCKMCVADGILGMKRKWEANTGLKACWKLLPRGKVQNKGERIWSLVLNVSLNTHALV